MFEQPAQSRPLTALFAALFYMLLVVTIPFAALGLRLLLRMEEPAYPHVPFWQLPVVMPLWYILGYFTVLLAGMWAVPTAARWSRSLAWTVGAAIGISVVAMLPVLFFTRLVAEE